MMPFSQMLSPSWQMMRTLDVATLPKVSSRSASPNVTTGKLSMDQKTQEL